MIIGTIVVVRPAAQSIPAGPGLIAGPPGMSAYETWLAAGNAGSVAVFLASLVGAKGDKGADGTNGTNGTNGANGTNGVQPWQTPPAAWASSTPYTATPPASVVTYNGACYVCSTSHTSGASFDGSKFTLIAAAGASTISSGSVVNSVRAQSSAVATTSVQTPLSDVAPTTSNTVLISGLSVTITPKATGNKLRVRAVLQGSLNVLGSIVGAVFQGAGTNAVAANLVTAGGNGYSAEVVVTYEVAAPSTAAVTFAVGAGSTGSGTLTVNGVGGSRYFGGVMFSSIEVTETLP
ncbi:hypothetical protein [Methylobacterium sp. E-046]|uniref:hypothetical protein n=1 Tax=Methylobacterium sp. E-046 TaxID=2836576 RepID=UPI001FB98A45|nr:hypothetical protein [Methylobacterium sp. E-046]MCJ2098931.1 hypothetical protein [Methylobacterium sp. E-046]